MFEWFYGRAPDDIDRQIWHWIKVHPAEATGVVLALWVALAVKE